MFLFPPFHPLLRTLAFPSRLFGPVDRSHGFQACMASRCRCRCSKVQGRAAMLMVDVDYLCIAVRNVIVSHLTLKRCTRSWTPCIRADESDSR
jgi:hypothetical protein